MIWTDDLVNKFWNFETNHKGTDERWFTYQVGRGILNFVNNKLSIANRVVLDYGAGKGFLVHDLINSGSKVQALEFSNDGFSHLENRFRNQSNFLGTILVETLPSSIPSNSVDVVFLVEVIEHLLDSYYESTFDEIFRVLKPEGYLIVTTPNDENLFDNTICCPNCLNYFHMMQHVRSFSRDSLKDFLLSQGFLNVKSYCTNFANYNTNSFTNRLRRFKEKLSKSKSPHLIGIAQKPSKLST